MSHAYQQYIQRFGPKNLFFLGSAGLYFLSLFFDHPVDVETTEELRSELSLLHQGTVVVVQEFLAATKKEQSLKW